MKDGLKQEMNGINIKKNNKKKKYYRHAET
jgi:hypothetical protein